jgi:hypothetical protein
MTMAICLVIFLSLKIDDDADEDRGDGRSPEEFVLLTLLFCIIMCMYTNRLITAPVSIMYPHLLAKSDSMPNLLLTNVNRIPDAIAIDAMTFIKLCTLGNKVE